MEVGCQGGRVGVPSWYQLTDPTWNSSNWKVVLKLSILSLLGTPSEVAVIVTWFICETTLVSQIVYSAVNLPQSPFPHFVIFISARYHLSLSLSGYGVGLMHPSRVL